MDTFWSPTGTQQFVANGGFLERVLSPMAPMPAKMDDDTGRNNRDSGLCSVRGLVVFYNAENSRRSCHTARWEKMKEGGPKKSPSITP